MLYFSSSLLFCFSNKWNSSLYVKDSYSSSSLQDRLRNCFRSFSAELEPDWTTRPTWPRNKRHHQISSQTGPTQTEKTQDSQSRMSLPETRGKDLSPPHHPPPHGTLEGGADPLLQSGAFIDAAAMEEAQSNGVDSVTSNGTPDGSAGRAKAKGSDPMPMDWLPAGWRVEYKVRTSGATAGCTDRYYYDPDSGRRFRSKEEVIRFLETGMLKKSTDSDKTSVEGSPSKKQKKSSTKPRPAVNFDFFDVPAKVEWVLTDSSQWTWAPFIGDQKVPESTAKEWATAFTVFTSSNSGGTQ